MAGIAGTAKDGAFSVCLSGGYKDDVDQGEFLYVTMLHRCTFHTNAFDSIYTGTGTTCHSWLVFSTLMEFKISLVGGQEDSFGVTTTLLFAF